MSDPLVRDCSGQTTQGVSYNHVAYSDRLLPRLPDLSFVTKLSALDRLLTPFILLAMIIGVLIGEFVTGVQDAFNTVTFNGVSVREQSILLRFLYLRINASNNLVAIAVGLIIMMWPVLAKVQYEKLPSIFTQQRLWIHIGLSIMLNWVVGPFLMLGLAWATLPDLPTYRTGVIMVGLGR